MNRNNRNVFRVSPAVCSALAITLIGAATAQDSARVRVPRGRFQGAIELRKTADQGNASIDPNVAQGPGSGPVGPGPGCNLFPAPTSVGMTVNLSYFGPPPWTSNQSLVGPVQLLKSGIVDGTRRSCRSVGFDQDRV